MEQETLSKIYNQKFYNALHRIEQKIPPIWLMRQAGRYHLHYQNLKTKHTFEELCKTPELICETTMGPIQDFDFDAAILFSDILFPLDYLGMGLTFNPGPEFSNPLTEQILNQEKEQSFSDYIKFQINGLTMIRDTLPKNKSLIGFVGAPYTLFKFAQRHPQSNSKLLDNFLPIVEKILEENIDLQFSVDLDILMIFDTEAQHLSLDEFNKNVKPFIEKIAIKYPGKIGYFTKDIDNEKFESLKTIIDLKLTVVGSNQDIFSKLSNTNLSLQGNFFNEYLAIEDINDFKKHLANFIKYIKDQDLSKRAGWICSLDHGVLKTTPEQNVKLFIETIRTQL
ncbi:MAG: uroporphyrinogen decarboxylase [alpha proteobacterium HIMB114]|nr:MAG: uroporphyrinogen decarboxylase [alpha proteobacterium HIMB114]